MKEAYQLDGEDEVWVIPFAEDDVLVVSTASGTARPRPRFDFQRALTEGDRLFSVAKSLLGRDGGVRYELSPESQRHLARLRKNYVGEYFRGVLRNEDGQITHQLQLREVREAVPHPQELLMAAQLHAMQLQLERIEDLLKDVAQSVADVMSFLEEHQRAEIEAVLDLVTGAYQRARATGRLASVDWERLSGIELALETQLRSVLLEIDRRLDGVELATEPKQAAKALEWLDPSRVHALFSLYGALATALGRWQELVLLRKDGAKETDHAEIAAFSDRLRSLANEADTRLGRVRELASHAAAVEPRSWWDRLWSDGLVIGAGRDSSNLEQVSKHVATLEGVVRGRATLPSSRPARPLLRLLPTGTGRESA